MKRISRKLMVLSMAFMLTILSFTYNFHLSYAADPVPVQQQVDQPSLWSLEDLQMLGVYDIVDPTMFSGFKLDATQQDMYIAGVKFFEKYTGESVTTEDVTSDPVALQNAVYKIFNIFFLDTDFNKTATRQDVVDMMYRLIKAVEPDLSYDINVSHVFDDASDLSTLKPSVQYLVTKGLLKGSNNNLNLTKSCTREQLLVLLSRVYYFAKQESETAAKGAFWKVSGGKNSVYLLGSVHLGDSRIYPMNDDMLEAFDNADVLAVEVNLLDMAEGQNYMQQKMFYQDGTTIDQVISEELYTLYAEKMESFGVQKEMYNILKPWSAAFTIQNLDAQANSDYSGGLGVDVYFMSKALNTKPIVEIEGLKFQTDLLDGFSPELQEGFLLGVLAPPAEETSESETDATSTEDESDETPAIVTALDQIFATWITGDIEGLEEVVAIDVDASDEFSTKFFFDRNDHMYETVLEYLEDDTEQTYFVVVGAGHMISDKGIVKLLQDKGYTVDQVK